jgi:ferredoxin
MSAEFSVSFPGHAEPPVSLPGGAALADHLDAANSPVLFGCRTGICGTCLVWVAGDVSPADGCEQEVVELFTADDPSARLACQLRCSGNVHMMPHPEAP